MREMRSYVESTGIDRLQHKSKCLNRLPYSFAQNVLFCILHLVFKIKINLYAIFNQKDDDPPTEWLYT